MLVYWRIAEATTALNTSCVALIPDFSDRSREGDKSKMSWTRAAYKWLHREAGNVGELELVPSNLKLLIV